MSARRLSLLAGLVAIGWTFALLRPTAESRDASPAAAGRKPASAGKSLSARSAAETRTAEHGKTQGDPRPELDPAARAALAEAAEAAARRSALLSRLATERNRRHDQRFDTAVQRWQEQKQRPRQEPWASRREVALRRTLAQDRLDALARSIECRTTMCRIEFRAKDQDTARQLRHARHFMREIGFQNAAGTIGEGEDRVMVLYAAREGTELTAPVPKLTTPPEGGPQAPAPAPAEQ